MSKLYVLYQHKSGYALFRVKEFEIGMLLSEVEASVEDLARFRALVKLIGFSAFKTTLAASENADGISRGILPEQLRIFLDSCIPKSSDRHVVILGIADPKLGASITEALNIKCDHNATIVRASLELNYSRVKIRFDRHHAGNATVLYTMRLMEIHWTVISVYLACAYANPSWLTVKGMKR